MKCVTAFGVPDGYTGDAHEAQYTAGIGGVAAAPRPDTHVPRDFAAAAGTDTTGGRAGERSLVHRRMAIHHNAFPAAGRGYAHASEHHRLQRRALHVKAGAAVDGDARAVGHLDTGTGGDCAGGADRDSHRIVAVGSSETLCARAPFGRNALRQVHLEERLVRDITLIRQHLELVEEPLWQAQRNRRGGRLWNSRARPFRP